jgi:peptide-methionine (S)-S-oxide reductase
MNARRSLLLLPLLAALLVPLTVAAAPPAAAPKPAAPKSAAPAVNVEHATFAGGCFWTMESKFEGFPGVQSVISGYCGGHEDNPTYEEVSSGTTGHLETIDVTFDPKKVTYSQLLDRYWRSIDPTQSNGQACDHGDEYRSAIFWHDQNQRRLAEASKQKLDDAHTLPGPIVTKIVEAKTFFPAEEYHQDFWKKNPEHYAAYREGCGRDRRLAQLWGKDATMALEH